MSSRFFHGNVSLDFWIECAFIDCIEAIRNTRSKIKSITRIAANDYRREKINRCVTRLPANKHGKDTTLFDWLAITLKPSAPLG